MTLISYSTANPEDGWASDAHVVQNGKAAFVVATERTLGMSVMVHTPWEGHTGYATMMVFRYKGLAPGDRIGFNRARTMKKASGCWAGTNKREVTLRFKVRRVQVQGVHERCRARSRGRRPPRSGCGRSSPCTAACSAARTSSSASRPSRFAGRQVAQRRHETPGAGDVPRGS